MQLFLQKCAFLQAGPLLPGDIWGQRLRAVDEERKMSYVFTRRQILTLAPTAVLVALTGWTQGPVRTQGPPPPEARVDINHASLPQLMKVPGMTQVWAERIVRFRPYHAKNDLLDRGVVTDAVYDRIKDYVIAHREPQ
jgi:DNA uptake protein ComE-like DNA-binding protein